MARTPLFRQTKRFAENFLRLRYREMTMTFAVLVAALVALGLFPGWKAAVTGLQTQVTPAEFALFFLIAAIGGVVKGLIGFGFATIVTSVFALMIDPRIAVIVLTVPPWVLNLFQLGETDSGLAMLRREWPLIGLALVGSALGVFALAEIALDTHLLFLIGLLILGYVAFQILRGFVTIRKASHPAIRGGMGFATGLVMAITNVGILFPLYVHTFERDTEQYVGLMSIFFLFLLTERIVQMSLMGLMTPYHLWLGSVIAIVTLVGLGIGSYLRRLKIDERRFNWLIIAILSMIALNMLRKTIPVVFPL